MTNYSFESTIWMRDGDDNSMIKKLYHGSSGIIEKPLYGYGKPYNDYCAGFYCADSLEMARVVIFIENLNCGINLSLLLN